jgi:ketosteroid isomerase-like protein
MKRILIIITSFLLLQGANAQKGIAALIAAEKNFAAFSIAHSTKEAFLQYIDSNSLMFDKGKPVKAQAYWKQREKNAGVLNWQPQFAEISASGDFGYTTGPWTFRLTAADSIVARGQYSTVWYFTKDSEWKFLIDLGVDDTPLPLPGEVIKIDFPKQMENTAAVSRIFPMIAAENEYVKAMAAKKYKTCLQYLSAQCILTRNGQAPAVTPEAQKAIIDSTPALKYNMEGWDISAIPDLGYVYGTTMLNGKKEGFFRVWRREKTGWKIALEVVRY